MNTQTMNENIIASILEALVGEPISQLTQSSCHVVGLTACGIPDQLSFLIASKNNTN